LKAANNTNVIHSSTNSPTDQNTAQETNTVLHVVDRSIPSAV